MTVGLGGTTGAIALAVGENKITVRVRAQDSSTTDYTVTITRQSLTPVMPTGLTAAAGNAQVTLSWTDPSDSSITKYQVRQKAGANAWTTWTDIPTSAPGETNATSYTVTSLANETAYRFRIRAVNAQGNSPQSDAAGPVTPSSAIKPAKPTGLSATAGNTQVALSWTDPGESSITKYQVQQKAGPMPGPPGRTSPAARRGRRTRPPGR